MSFLFRFEAVLSGGSGGFPYFVAYVFTFVSSVRKDIAGLEENLFIH